MGYYVSECTSNSASKNNKNEENNTTTATTQQGMFVTMRVELSYNEEVNLACDFKKSLVVRQRCYSPRLPGHALDGRQKK